MGVFLGEGCVDAVADVNRCEDHVELEYSVIHSPVVLVAAIGGVSQ